MRQGLEAHWRLSALLGGHFPSSQSSVQALSLLGHAGADVASYQATFRDANYAKHSAPPDFPGVPKVASDAIAARTLEEFRSRLYSPRVEAPLPQTPPAIAPSFGDAEARFVAAVSQLDDMSSASFGSAEARSEASPALAVDSAARESISVPASSHQQRGGIPLARTLAGSPDTQPSSRAAFRSSPISEVQPYRLGLPQTQLSEENRHLCPQQ